MSVDILEIVDIGSSSLDEKTNVLTVQAGNADDEDFQSHEDIAMWGQLGVTARPYPSTEEGSCQAVLYNGPSKSYVMASRDTRVTSIYGQLSEGDVAIHSTGETAASRIFLKEESKTVAIMSKASDDKDMMIVMDGTNDKITMSAFKQVIEMSRDEGITLGIEGSGGASALMMKPDGSVWITATSIHLEGQCFLGPSAGALPVNFAAFAPAPSPGGPSSLPFQIAPNVIISAV